MTMKAKRWIDSETESYSYAIKKEKKKTQKTWPHAEWPFTFIHIYLRLIIIRVNAFRAIPKPSRNMHKFQVGTTDILYVCLTAKTAYIWSQWKNTKVDCKDGISSKTVNSNGGIILT